MYGKVHVLKEYDAETKETTTLEYIIKDGDTIFHGKFINYNEKGNKTYEGNFVNGQIKGESIFYYDNGTIESVHYRKTSKILEESFYYHPNGKDMRYMIYDDLGISAFIIDFDEKGNVENYKGYPIMEVYQSKIANKEKSKTKINQYLKVGDTLKHQYLIAYIPNAKRDIRIKNMDSDYTKVKSTLKKTSQISFDIEEVLTTKGINTIIATVKYEFDDKEKTVINDATSFKIQVH
ncbi:hypothetical protein BC749_1011065 [Flavobacterium araucananum]|uniref:MORN repeat protein n=1 Tax=Flavobacterium araucananum TaxID=946678 RepID=A0A227PI84_9FLAO|nr:hypothetical protein [Flavobacterium araucananum]OXG09579.1 hypothetical protein B0A64_02160 [Flavobacterium araucananum]PWK02980.1 hypothetical protein BC749_1011065 [Flavobacterium araucananum]